MINKWKRNPVRSFSLVPLLAALLLPLLHPVPAGAAKKWVFLKEKAGVKVYKRDLPNTSIVEFKGKGVINASVLDIMAVLGDSDRITEWTACRKFRMVKKIDEMTTVMYCQVRAPFPFQDRDFVAKSKFVVDEKRKWLHIRSDSYKKYPGIPPKSGIVRMPWTKVRWSFKRLSKNKTWVEYRGAGDPGGVIPKWVVNLVSKNIPLDTMLKLRKRLKTPGMIQDKFKRKYLKYDTWGLPGAEKDLSAKAETKPGKPKKKKSKKKKKKKRKKK